MDPLTRAADLHRAGRLEEAATVCLDLLGREPGNAEARHLLGIVAFQLGDAASAEQMVAAAIAAAPEIGRYHFTRGRLLQHRGDAAAALAAYREAVARDPALTAAWLNRGVMEATLGRADEALASFGEALARDPDHVDALNNRGELLRQQGRMTEARACLERALALAPDSANARHNLGNVLLALHRLDEAAECFRRAAAAAPATPMFADAWLLSLLCSERATPADIFAAHRDWGGGLEARLADARLPLGNDRDPDRRLRIGYVSPDFRRHPVAQFIGPVLAHHDPAQFDVVCYHTHEAEDETTRRLRALAPHWRAVATLPLAGLIDQVRRDGIDILVDLAGHTTGNRLALFAARPAPVQMTWLGYLGTTGLTAIDYRITDAWMDPEPVADALHTERLLRLPGCQWCYEPDPAAPPPTRAGGGIAFGSFNNPMKITGPVIDCWARLLGEVPEATLLLASVSYEETRGALTAAFGARGVPPERLRFRPKLPMADYLRLYGGVDVALDPFPYCGGTTTFDALWMGVPVVTLAGSRTAGRGGVSILANLGLPELVAADEAGYVRLAAALATDTPGLATLRSTLRPRLARSPLTDGAAFTGALESLYRTAWRRRCADRAAM